jgi:hypothetical protein
LTPFAPPRPRCFLRRFAELLLAEFLRAGRSTLQPTLAPQGDGSRIFAGLILRRLRLVRLVSRRFNDVL